MRAEEWPIRDGTRYVFLSGRGLLGIALTVYGVMKRGFAITTLYHGAEHLGGGGIEHWIVKGNKAYHTTILVLPMNMLLRNMENILNRCLEGRQLTRSWTRLLHRSERIGCRSQMLVLAPKMPSCQRTSLPAVAFCRDHKTHKLEDM